MRSIRRGTLWCLLLLAFGTGCVGHSALNGGGAPLTATPATTTTAPAPLPGFPTLGAVSRQGSIDENEFVVRQSGSDFAPDLASNHCVKSGAVASFSPQWSNGMPNPSGNAAYAIYRLKYDPAALPVVLTLAWNGDPPADADCWVGLSDWTGNVWRWMQPVNGQLPLSDPGNYVDAQQHCFVAVLLLGNSASTLYTIGFGNPWTPSSADGYTLFAPLGDTDTYLIDMNGIVANKWSSQYQAAGAVQLLENGHMLRLATLGNGYFSFGGSGGLLEEYDWDGNLVWSYELSNNQQCTHHDFTVLPNGNILMLVSNLMTKSEITGQGRDPATVSSARFWVDSLEEVHPTLPSGGDVVWEWRITDHLIQNFDSGQPNYGDPMAHPELVDLNFPPNKTNVQDWTHANCVAYNPHFDQVMVTVLNFSEIWVVDHSTTTAEAASHSGGTYGHGGDLLYRWGNPQSYGGGTSSDEQFYGCHHGHWIGDGLDGAGDILVFQNRTNNQQYSQVVQFAPPQNPDGSYNLTGTAYGPSAPDWVFQATPPESFSSNYLGSAQRLPGGITLVDSGAQANFFEVDTAGNILWQYHNDYPLGYASISPVFRALRYLPDYPGLAALH